MWQTFLSSRLWVNMILLPWLAVGIFNFVTLQPQYSKCDEDSDPIRNMVILTNSFMCLIGLHGFVPYYQFNLEKDTCHWICYLLEYAFFTMFYIMFFISILTTDNCEGSPAIDVFATHSYEYGWYIVISILLLTPAVVGIVVGIGALCWMVYILPWNNVSRVSTPRSNPPSHRAIGLGIDPPRYTIHDSTNAPPTYDKVCGSTTV